MGLDIASRKADGRGLTGGGGEGGLGGGGGGDFGGGGDCPTQQTDTFSNTLPFF